MKQLESKISQLMFVILFSVAFLMYTISCSDDSVVPEVNISGGSIDQVSNSMDFSSESQSKILSFSSNVSWTITVSETQNALSWCTVSQNKGEAGVYNVSVTVTENTTYSDRNVVLVLTAGSITKSIIVNQKQNDAITLTSNRFEIGTSGGIINVEVKSNVDYTVQIAESCKEWITLSGNTRSLSAKTYSFHIAESKEYDKREGEIIFSSNGITETIRVYQSGSAILVLSQNEYTVDSKASSISIDISSNFNYVIDMPNVDWIKPADKTRAISSHTLVYDICENTSYADREAVILFKDVHSDKTESVSIKQKQNNAILLSNNKIEMGQGGGTFSVDVNSNVDYVMEIASSCSSWLTLNPQSFTSADSRALSEQTYKFSVNKSEEYEKRMGEIYFKSKDLSDTLRVYQSGGAIFVLSSESIHLNGEMQDISITVKSNITYTISISDGSWIQPVSTRAVSTSTPSFHVLENKTGMDRSANIVFTTKEKKYAVKVSQDNLEPQLIVGKTQYYLDGKAQEVKIELQSNYDCEIVLPDVDWIKQTDTRGLSSHSFAFSIAENDTWTRRSVQLQVRAVGTDISQAVTIHQEFAVPDMADDLWDGTVASNFYSYGKGTSESPYIITSCAQIARLSQEVNNGNKMAGVHLMLVTNLNFNNRVLVPIGTPDRPFSGSFDGNGKKMEQFCVSGTSYLGLFGYTQNATINDVYIDITTIASSPVHYAGGVVAYAENTSITNCCTFGQVSGQDCSGGLVGYLDASSSMMNCFSACQNTCGYLAGSVGGLVGYHCGIMHCCYFYGSLNALDYIKETTGGIVGYVHTDAYMNCCYFMKFPVGAMNSINFSGSLNWGICYFCGSFDMYGNLSNGEKLSSVLNRWVNQSQTEDGYYRSWTTDSYPQFIY